jgi:hypothetical protein
LRTGADLTPTEFSVKGKSYRFVNVDAAVKVAGGIATVPISVRRRPSKRHGGFSLHKVMRRSRRARC